jgi:hypothetical protein
MPTRSRGDPIGTGITEAAAKTIVGTDEARRIPFLATWRSSCQDLPSRGSPSASTHSIAHYAPSIGNRYRRPLDAPRLVCTLLDTTTVMKLAAASAVIIAPLPPPRAPPPQRIPTKPLPEGP